LSAAAPASAAVSAKPKAISFKVVIVRGVRQPPVLRSRREPAPSRLQQGEAASGRSACRALTAKELHEIGFALSNCPFRRPRSPPGGPVPLPESVPCRTPWARQQFGQSTEETAKEAVAGLVTGVGADSQSESSVRSDSARRMEAIWSPRPGACRVAANQTSSQSVAQSVPNPSSIVGCRSWNCRVA
jgi:hypothetical protein